MLRQIQIETTNKFLMDDINKANIPDIEVSEYSTKSESLMNNPVVIVTVNFLVSIAAGLFIKWLDKYSNKNSPGISKITINNTTNNISINELKVIIKKMQNEQNESSKKEE